MNPHISVGEDWLVKIETDKRKTNQAATLEIETSGVQKILALITY